MPRIVSLLPAATEIVCALGARGDLVGRSHECDYPAGVESLPVISRPALGLDGLAQSEIDAAVSSRLAGGESLYLVDEVLLRDLAPDVILTQDLCQVCAPSGNELSRALRSVPSRPNVVYLTPRTLAEIDENIIAVGEAIGRGNAATELVDSLHRRLAELREKQILRSSSPRSESHLDDGGRPRVAFLEWTDPPYCAGHWVPEMIELAGGHDPLGRSGADSVRVSWHDVLANKPEVVIVAPCGFGLAEAERIASELPDIPGARIHPVDANAFFARPGPRYVDGIELLTEIFHPARVKL